MPKTLGLKQNPYWTFAKKYRRQVVLGLSCLLFTNSLEVSVPWLIGRALDKLTQKAPFSEIQKITLIILVVTFFLSIFRFLWRMFWARFHHTVADDLRNSLFLKYAHLSPSFFRTKKVGQLMTLITNDVNSFRMGIGPGFLILFDGLFQTLMIIPIMISISPSWTWKTLILMPTIPFVIRYVMNRLSLAFSQRQQNFSEVSGVAQEIVSGVRVIKSFAQEDVQTKKFDRFSKVYEQSCNRVAFWDAIFSPSMELPVALGCVVLLFVGAPEVLSGAITIGAFFSFYQYVQRMVWPMTAFGIAMSHLQEGLASYKRIEEILDVIPDVRDEGTQVLRDIVTLEVKDLSFSYPDQLAPALKNISFVLNKGECLGIVGETGSGKTTLIELLARLYPVPSGKILINGISIEEYTLSSLRGHIRFVPQDAFLFSETVKKNMGFSRDEILDDHLIKTAQDVRIHDEVMSWPSAYESIVGERGVNLSGGQKQRMTLARALMKEGGMSILDDTLSAVDAKTEESILTVLRSELSSRTAIVVSHRLASLAWANKILVLNKGYVEQVGTHSELIKTSPTYSSLYEMQYKERGATP